MVDRTSQSEIDGLTADDPRFNIELNLRIESMRALHDAMASSSAETGFETGHSAFHGMAIDEQVRALTNLK